MTCTSRWTLLLVFGMAYAASGGAPPLDEYALITSRNIFDRNRRPPVAVVARPEPPQPAPAPRVMRTVTLAGVIMDSTQKLAFVMGSDGNGSVEIGQALAGDTVVDITSDGVKLGRHGDGEIWRVGVALRETDDGKWTETAAPPPRGAAEKPSDGASDSAGQSTSSGSDILRRMMERRRKELGK